MGITTVDPLFKQNLSEWVYDEHKLVTYQYLSAALEVHVNVAKQMLYEFYEEEQKKEKKTKSAAKIHALYHVSGLTPSPDSDQSVYTTTICGDEQLDSVTGKFTKLSSLHIYAVRATGGEGGTGDDDNASAGAVMKKLSRALKEVTLMKADDSGSAVGFGPFVGAKPKPKDSSTPPLSFTSSSGISTSGSTTSSVASTKFKNIEEKPKSSPKKAEPKATKQKESPWTKAATGAKPKIETKSESPPPKSAASATTSLKRSRSEAEGSMKTRSTAPAKKNGASAAHKGILAVIDSDSDSENDSAQSSPASSPPRAVSPPAKKKKKTPAVVESPPPARKSVARRRIRMLIDSDSDDEDFQQPTKGKGQSTLPAVPVEAAKGKRKTKVVTTQVMDEDGYLVTKREKVSDSESEGEGTPEVTKGSPETKSPPATSPPPKKSSSSDTKSPLKSPPAPKKSAKRTSSTASGPKSKQTTLTSFFIKKS